MHKNAGVNGPYSVATLTLHNRKNSGGKKNIINLLNVNEILQFPQQFLLKYNKKYTKRPLSAPIHYLT